MLTYISRWSILAFGCSGRITDADIARETISECRAKWSDRRITPVTRPCLVRLRRARARRLGSVARCARMGETRVQGKIVGSRRTAFVSALQVQVAAKENRFHYDAIASGDSLYNYFRAYDPRIGRYIQSDPIGLKAAINTYAYADGDPLRLIDVLGLQSCPVPLVDNAGLKVSPRAQYLPPPGDCGEGEQRRMQEDVDSSCKQERACRPGMTQIEIIINREKNRECATSRDRINKKCFAGGDQGHRNAANDAWRALANCDGMMR